MADEKTVAIIVPFLNEKKALPLLLAALLRLQPQELIFVDGGSNDGSDEWLRGCSKGQFSVLSSAPGRAQQMNRGASVANAEILLFLHADTHLPDTAMIEVQKGSWGRFDVRFSDNRHPNSLTLSLVEAMINLRSRLSGVATGDQAMFVRRDLFNRVGGFSDIPLMEDVALSKSLKRIHKPYCSRAKVDTSARRWKKNGIWKTVLLMWALRCAYFFGIPADYLKRFYH